MLNPDAAGIDVGASEHYVAVPAERDEQAVRRFGAFTEDLHKLAQWLLQCGVRTVALESTGVYWIPLYQILEDYGLVVKLVNARHVKHVPGRKSDVQDCQWLQQLESFGLLSGSFRPEAKICILRSYMRQRQMLISTASRHIQQMQKALTQMNLKVHQVLSDLSGQTGMRIVRAILQGERDRMKLAALKDRRVKSSLGTIAKSLEGDYRAEHLFALRQAVELYDYYQLKIAECDQEILKELQSLETRATPGSAPPAPLKRKGRSRHNLIPYDGQAELYRILGVDLTRIDGLNEATVQLILSELGLDLCKKWPTEAQFASWLGLAPNNEISGGKVLRRGTRRVVNRVANALRMCAESLLNSKSALGAYARRMRAKRDAKIAITATAHKLARLIYRTLKHGQEYSDIGQIQYEARYRTNVLKSLQKKARLLGFQLVDLSTVTIGVP
ncbi:MAG TPA: IS110 family transposase [Pyrinomonadaceae bacterium]|nr:IS110 family transposase [Pyrinomonadaceae bacterium]